MPTYTANLGATKLVEGQAGAHVVVNEALDVVDKAIAGCLAIDMVTHGADTKVLTGGESTHAILHVTDAGSASWLVVQAVSKLWVVVNDSAYSLTVQTAGQLSPPTIAAGAVAQLVCDGADVRLVG
ncbi:MAG: hypothetical protein H6948_16185 [Zoogloeaceae bacterium]|nr:hypothetical protein [Rhodocyclaceae bacterium]MCP5233590.1 hypothetical protein [Zoogloeaceae bacterium]